MWRWTARWVGVPTCAFALAPALVAAAPAHPAAANPPAAQPAAAQQRVAQQGVAQQRVAQQGVPAAQQGVRGVSVEIVELPDRFVVGAPPVNLTVVASKSTGACLKVRWSLLLQLDGLELEQLRVERVEENGPFPMDLEQQGDSARLTDEQLDPGTLCSDRTVTARYQINVANDVGEGRLTLFTEVYDARLRLLERDSASRPIVSAGAPAPSESAAPSASPSADPTGDSTGAEPTDAAATPPGGGSGAGGTDANEAAGSPEDGLPLAWFMIGALMVFLGLSLLFNVRWRHQRAERAEAVAPVTAPPAGTPPVDRPSRYRTVPRRARGW